MQVEVHGIALSAVTRTCFEHRISLERYDPVPVFIFHRFVDLDAQALALLQVRALGRPSATAFPFELALASQRRHAAWPTRLHPARTARCPHHCRQPETDGNQRTCEKLARTDVGSRLYMVSARSPCAAAPVNFLAIVVAACCAALSIRASSAAPIECGSRQLQALDQAGHLGLLSFVFVE